MEPDLRQRTREALERANGALTETIRALARVPDAAEPGGDRLEPHQTTAFALAQLAAQARAAREAVSDEAATGSDALLAVSYAGRAVAALRERLPTLMLQLDELSPDALAPLESDAVRDIVRETTSRAFTDRVWAALQEGGEPWAERLEETHRLLRQTFRQFAEAEVRPIAERLHRQDELVPEPVIAKVAELGAFGLSIPEAHGGFQERPDHVGMVLVTEELSRGALVVGSLATRPEILAKALLKGGTPAQQARWLPRLAAGEDMVGIAVTEPDFGSDVAKLKVTARPDGDGYRVSGTKTWSTFAGRADVLQLLARTEPDAGLGHKGLSMFVIEKPRFAGHEFTHESGGGRLSGRAIATLGYRGMHSFELNFEDYYVPAANLVGEEAGRGRGFYLQMEGFAGARLQTAGRALGVMQAAFEAGRDYAASRRVFGRPLESYPLTREKLVRMAATVHGCRRATFAAAREMDEGGGQISASMVKFLACREAEWITREAQQLHGGMGYAEEFAVSRYYVDARVLSIFEGAEEVLALKVILPALIREAG